MKEIVIPEEVLEILESPSSIKMIGTVDSEKNVNLAHVQMVKVVGKDTIAFAYFCHEGKAIENIRKNKNLSLAIFEPEIIAFQLKGRVKEIVEGGNFDSFRDVNDEPRPAGIVNMKVRDIYALTMALAGERVA